MDDLIEGMMRMMDAPDAFIGPFNLGNPGEFTILELAEKVIPTTGSRSKIIFQLLPQDDPLQRKPDILLAGEKLGCGGESGSGAEMYPKNKNEERHREGVPSGVICDAAENGLKPKAGWLALQN